MSAESPLDPFSFGGQSEDEETLRRFAETEFDPWSEGAVEGFKALLPRHYQTTSQAGRVALQMMLKTKSDLAAMAHELGDDQSKDLVEFLDSAAAELKAQAEMIEAAAGRLMVGLAFEELRRPRPMKGDRHRG